MVPTIQRMVEEGGTYKLQNVMVGFRGELQTLATRTNLT